MNTKAIALFAVLAVALTGGFAIAGADAADGDDFTAEYWTDGLVYSVSATFDVALDSKIQWVGSIYDGETSVMENRNMTYNGNVLTTMWFRSALEVGEYTLVIFDNPKTVEYTGTFTVHADPVVTFYVDGEPREPVTVPYGKTVVAPEMPVKVGYSFDGWYLSGELTPFDFSTSITEDTALYGSYKLIDYTVKVVNQDGKQIGETKTANFGEKVEFEVIEPLGSEAKSAVSSPVIEDFDFNAETCEGSFTMPASNVTITVTFELIDCTVTFYVDGEPRVPVTVKYGKTVEAPEMPVKVGYSFDGWYLSGELTPFDFTTPITEDTALYGSYEPIEYTVNVVDQVGNTLDDPQKVYYGMPALFKFPVNLLGAVPTSVTSSVPDVEITYDLELGTGMFTMPASDVTVTVTYTVIPELYDAIVKLDGEVIKDDQFVEGEPVVYDLNEYILVGVEATISGPEGLEYDFDKGVLSFEMPAADVEFTLVLNPIVPETATVVFIDGETETEVVVNMGECVVAPKEAGKEGYNFVGWFKDGYEKSFDFKTPITEDLTLFAKYVETPQIEGFAVLYHDMYQGKPVDIWWKGYASKDDRVSLANGMDANPGVVFKGWLAEDQKTLLTWNAAYDLNDLDRNDCLIYPAYYGYPGNDGIYELNAIYELHIQWIGFDGETVIDEQDVERGKFLVPKYSDDGMASMLEQEMPSDKQYKYSWTGWRIGDSETTYTSEQIGSVKVDGAWKIYATYGKDLNKYDITFNWHDGTSTIKVPYGDTPEIENPPAYEDDNFTYTFAGWDPEVTKVTGDATYTATYDKTSKTKDVTITVNDFAYGYFTYNDEKQTADYILKVPMDAEAPVIDGNVLTFDFVRYKSGDEVPETNVFTAFPNPDDTMHYEFIEWTVSEDGNTYTANFVTDIITSKDLDRILTFFDSTKAEDGKVRFTIGSKDGLAIPKGTMTVYYYEMEFNKRLGIYTQVEKHCDPISMDWGEDYGKNLISATIVYDDLKQDGEAFDITTKDISVMWLDFDGVNEAESKSNKATPGQ